MLAGPMHLIYMDESGNTGIDLNDENQPIFLLCALIVDEAYWQQLEIDLRECAVRRLPLWSQVPNPEIHAADIRRAEGVFEKMSVADRIGLRDEWMDIGQRHGVKPFYQMVHKKGFAKWLVKNVGAGIIVNPHVFAFPLLAKAVNAHLAGLPGQPLGMFISDENKDVYRDVEKSLHFFRTLEGVLKLSRIVEKGFFIDSKKSLPLQLCDLYAYSLRKQCEREIGRPPKSFDDSGVAKATAISTRTSDFKDVLEKLMEVHGAKK